MKLRWMEVVRGLETGQVRGGGHVIYDFGAWELGREGAMELDGPD
jgi:hypothetical protein